MKILVISDSHQHVTNLKKIVEAAIAEGVKALIFLGDGIDDLKNIEAQEVSVYTVLGNMDKGKGEEKLIEIEGRRILLIHGNQLGYQHNFEQFLERRRNIDILLYGHTHKQYKRALSIDDHTIEIYNPGSVAEGNFAILEITPTKIHFNLRRL